MSCKYVIDDPGAEYDNKELLYHLYWGIGWTAQEIARYTRAQSKSAVQYRLHRHGIPLRDTTRLELGYHLRDYERDGETIEVIDRPGEYLRTEITYDNHADPQPRMTGWTHEQPASGD